LEARLEVVYEYLGLLVYYENARALTLRTTLRIICLLLLLYKPIIKLALKLALAIIISAAILTL